jgi:hypothetical protein
MRLLLENFHPIRGATVMINRFTVSAAIGTKLTIFGLFKIQFFEQHGIAPGIFIIIAVACFLLWLCPPTAASPADMTAFLNDDDDNLLPGAKMPGRSAGAAVPDNWRILLMLITIIVVLMILARSVWKGTWLKPAKPQSCSTVKEVVVNERFAEGSMKQRVTVYRCG